MPVDGEYDDFEGADFEPVLERELAADDELESRRLRRGVRADDTRDRALVGEREPGIAELGGPRHELGRMRRAAQEREITEAMKLAI
jgi:hypothetical protein